MGQTLNNVVATNKTYDKFKNIMFVPIVGGISQSTVDGADVQGNEIARKFADKFGGTYTQFLSPAVFSDKMILNYFMQEKAVNYILDEFRKINIAVVSLGIPEKADHTLFKAGYATQRELRTLAECGAVGDVALQFYDEEGNTEKFHFFNDRVASMQLDMIRKIPVRIGIAGGGKKVHSVIGAIHGGFFEILQDSMTILAEVCEWPDEIDVGRAEAAKVRAERRLLEGKDGTDMGRAILALKRSAARIEAAGK